VRPLNRHVKRGPAILQGREERGRESVEGVQRTREGESDPVGSHRVGPLAPPHVVYTPRAHTRVPEGFDDGGVPPCSRLVKRGAAILQGKDRVAKRGKAGGRGGGGGARCLKGAWGGSLNLGHTVLMGGASNTLMHRLASAKR